MTPKPNPNSVLKRNSRPTLPGAGFRVVTGVLRMVLLATVRLWIASAGLYLATENANAWVVNSLDVADIQNQSGATILQNGNTNVGQYGIVIPAGLVPQEVAIVVSGNTIGGSFNVSRHDYRLQINNATLSSFNSEPIHSLDMGSALNQYGQAAGTVTTAEGWVVYDSATYHSESGEGANSFDDNHLLYFRIDALNPTSQSFNLAAYSFFSTSSVTRIISVQSHNDSTAGIVQLSNDANAPVSVFRSSVTPAYVAGPRPHGAAIDAGTLGSLIQNAPPVAPVVIEQTEVEINGQAKLTVSGTAGVTYVLQRRYFPQSWMDIQTNHPPSTIFEFVDPAPGNGAWYRVRTEP